MKVERGERRKEKGEIDFSFFIFPLSSLNSPLSFFIINQSANPHVAVFFEFWTNLTKKRGRVVIFDTPSLYRKRIDCLGDQVVSAEHFLDFFEREGHLFFGVSGH